VAPTVSIIGATLTGNRGAEAMLVTSIAKVRERFPGAKFFIHSYFPDEDRALTDDPAVEIVDASPVALVLQYFPASVAERAVRTVGLKLPGFVLPAGPRGLRDSDMLLDVFGVSYNDGREKFLPFNVLSNWPAMLMGTPVVKLSQGMGTYNHPVTRAVGKWMLGRCRRVFARGKESLKMATDVGLGPVLGYAPDIAFLYEPSHSLSEENPDYSEAVAADLAKRKAAGGRILIFSLSAVVEKKVNASGQDYIAEMASIVDAMLERGLTVVLLPNANREGVASRHNNDIPVVEAVEARVQHPAAGEHLIALRRGLNAGGLREVIREADYMVASRFHAMIAGLALGVPTLVLGWSHKYREILAMFGLQDWAYDFSELDVKVLVKRIDELIEGAATLRENIANNIERVNGEAQAQFDWLADALRAAPSARS